MRLWHRELLPHLPDLQFKGQLRELVAIMHDWRDKGKTNHLLINRVMEYPQDELTQYFFEYSYEYYKRYGKPLNRQMDEFNMFSLGKTKVVRPIKMTSLYEFWHNKKYLRVCMANLYEKHYMGIGKSRITDEEWARLCEGYKSITGEVYQI